jgi:hypothetical protein
MVNFVIETMLEIIRIVVIIGFNLFLLGSICYGIFKLTNK